MNVAARLAGAALAGALLTPVSAVETAQTQSTNTQTEPLERARGSEWALNLEEYRRYQSLMKGMRGSISDPRITPIEVLGIHARSDAERQKYAEQFAKMMAEDTQRVLSFQLAYQAAFKRLYPSLPVMYVDPASNRPPSLQQVLDTAPSVRAGEKSQTVGLSTTGQAAQTGLTAANMTVPASVNKGDRLIVFTGSSCPICDSVVNQAKLHTAKGVAVDVYVVGAKSPDDVVSYANQIRIDPQLVRSGRLTLNVDQGTMARVLPREKSLPQVVRKRGELLTSLSMNEL